MAVRILEREKSAILKALGAGVVPRIGLHHIQVGRKQEISALLDDLKRIEGGGATIRFVVGRFGAGKSFFLNVIQTVAMERKFLVARADITTDRRLQATGGQAQGLFTEMMKNLSTRPKPEGGALANVIEKWVGDVSHEVSAKGGTTSDVEKELDSRCTSLQDLVGGFEFLSVLKHYYRAHLAGNDVAQAAALRWLRAEYSTKTEARQELGVRSIIDDDSYYDYLKLLARFAKLAGYSGLLVCLDELVVLSHRLQNRTARNNNYEAILRIVNDCLQGGAEHLGFIFAATDECMFDKRRGLHSYEALASRLASNLFASRDIVDLAGPVLTLANLTREDCYVLLHNVRRVHSGGDETRYAIPDEGIEAYQHNCEQRMGAAYYQTPRDTIKDFIGLLNVIRQNPSSDWKALIGQIKTEAVESVDPSVASAVSDDDDLATFKL